MTVKSFIVQTPGGFTIKHWMDKINSRL